MDSLCCEIHADTFLSLSIWLGEDFPRKVLVLQVAYKQINQTLTMSRSKCDGPSLLGFSPG